MSKTNKKNMGQSVFDRLKALAKLLPHRLLPRGA